MTKTYYFLSQPQGSANDSAALFGEPVSRPPVLISRAPWYMPGLGEIQVDFSTWTKHFDLDVTGLGIAETQINLIRLASDVLKSVTIPKGRLMSPHIGQFSHVLLGNLLQFKDAIRRAEIAIDVAESVRPDLLQEGDVAGTMELALSYFRSAITFEGASFSVVQFASVLMPTPGEKPAVIIATNDALPEIFARFYKASAGS